MTGIICSFDNVEVLEERYNNAIKEFWDTTLQVDRDGFFVADGKWKVSWKKITHLQMNHDIIQISTVQGDPHHDNDDDGNDHDNNDRDAPHSSNKNHHKKKKGLQVQARLASNARATNEWSSFQHYVTKKWSKLQEKKQRLHDAIQQQAEEEAREARRAAAKPKRSRVERFFMKNLANIKTFDDESDDETFNRRNHKVLMAERKDNAEQHPKSDNAEEDQDQEAILDDQIAEAEPPKARNDKAWLAQHKTRRLKRKGHHEDDDSDDDRIFDAGPSITEVSKRAVVTPGATTLKKAAILDDEDMEAEETNADISNVPSITSYFKPKISAGTTAATKKPAFPVVKAAQSGASSTEVTTTKMPEEPPAVPIAATNKIAKNAAPVNFFAPRVTKAAVTQVKKREETSTSDEDTVVATPPREAPRTPPREAPRTPPRSSYKHLYQQSASKIEHDEDHVMDFVDERHVSPMRQTHAAPMKDRMTPETQKRRRNFFGTKAPPSRNSAVLALDQADKSPVRRNLYEGLDIVSPSRRGSASALSSPPRKRTAFASPRSPMLTKAISPSAVPALSSSFPGLRNLGNTCYINSSLQMLFSIPDFVQDLKPFSHGRRLVDSLCDTFLNVIHPAEGAVGSVSAKKLKVAVDSTTDKFRGYQQRDAHEFLGHLIDEIHEEIEPKKSEDDEAPSSSQEASSKDELLPTDDYFRLNVEVCLKCKSCGYSRTKEEMYRYLSLDIGCIDQESSAVPTVEQCLESFFEPEDREIKCEKCDHGVAATQTLRVLSRPRVLLLHLKRFTMVEKRTSGTDELEVSFRKNKTPVELNNELSLDAFLSDKATSSSVLSSNYSLRSIVHHIGMTANSGHYTADALREKKENGTTANQWVSYDDSTTTEKTLDEIQTTASNKKTAYMLLYSTESRGH